jgi:ABC-2 type transport system permease protein
LSSLWALRGVDLATLGLTAEQATAVAAQLAAVEGGGLLPFAGLVERLAAMTLHVALSVLVWRAFKERRWWLVLVALGLHTLFDTTAVALTQLTDNVWLIEAVLVTAAGLLGVWVWRGWPRNGRPVRLVNPLRVDVQLFLTALRKEMREMWQTRRVIAITAVFLVFGLVSPLLAKFTPQLLMSVEGAEQFADLIPEPTTADAMGQYIKNLTQFAFILVILLGMGAVAGEKDKGTATMILSKPLPRWAFLLSKFSAQAAVYALAMMLAALGAYYYTMVLFEPLLMGPFLLGNVLLWLWLLVLAAVTLLGSSLARSVGMAAGLALFGGVLVLLSGSLPRVGPLMPGALVAWASQLGLVAEVPVNGGAVALGVVLMVVCLVTAVAVFEQQEL